MPDLFRQSVGASSAPPSPLRPSSLISAPAYDQDDGTSSSSDSSASSAASVVTVRPSSRENEAPPSHWTNYVDQELFWEQESDGQHARYHAYLTLPKDVKKGPLFICHHGAGASGLSFALFAAEIRSKLPDAGVLSLEARGHGSIVTSVSDGSEIVDYSLTTLVSDAVAMITLTAQHLNWPCLPPSVLVGHSLGGAVVTNIATTHFRIFGATLIGYAVLDVVEGSAIEALTYMKTYLASRPPTFANVSDGVAWHLRTRTLRSAPSAEVSVPSLLVPSSDPPDSLTWRTDLSATAPWWESWFRGMSQNFLAGRGAKLLILAGTDRLDRELMIGQMQGKFQLSVIPEAGHFVQEDAAERVAGLLAEFFKRNDRSQMVLPPKVSDLIAQGKKV